MRKSLIKLHPNQSKIFLDNSLYRVLVAGRKFGKSTLMLAELLRAVKTIPNVVYIAPTYKMARNTLWLDHIKKFIPDELLKDKHETDLRLTFRNGNMITLYGADDPDRLRGLNIGFAGIDEVADIKPTVWEMIIEPNLLATKGRALFVGTPKGKKNQMYELYNMQDSIYSCYHFTSYDNLMLDKAKLDAIRERLIRQGKEDVWKQEYMAMFTVLAGMIYDNWNRDIHIADPDIGECTYAFSVDRGMENPSAVGFYKIYRKEGEDRIHRYDEIYKAGLSPSELVSRIRQKMGTREFVYQYCDPSAKDFIAVAKDEGLNIDPAVRETGGKEVSWVREGISKCKGWLAKSLIDGKPKFTVSKNCVYFIEEIEGYIWEERPDKDEAQLKDRPRKLNDHAVDEWRYLIVSFQKPLDDDEDWAEDKTVERLKGFY